MRRALAKMRKEGVKGREVDVLHRDAAKCRAVKPLEFVLLMSALRASRSSSTVTCISFRQSQSGSRWRQMLTDKPSQSQI